MHDHDHGGTATARYRWRIAAVLGVTLAVFAAELVTALISGSLALLADAGHMFADSVGLALALVGVTLAQRPPTSTRTWGLARAEILAAALNAAVLLALGIWVVVESVQRLTDASPAEVAPTPVLIIGLVGLAGNLIGVAILAGGRKESLNMRGAFLDVAADSVASVLVIVSALVIQFTGFEAADTIAALLIACFIVPRAWKLLRESVDVLLEATPRGLDLDKVRADILAHSLVLEVHDLHASTVTSGLPVLTAHVVVAPQCFTDSSAPQVLDWLQELLASQFDVEHSTFQLEVPGHRSHEQAQHT